MNRLMRTILIITGAIGFAGSALAQQQHDGYGFVMGSYVESDSVLNLDDGKGLQLGGGWALSKLWNMEVFYQHTKTDGTPNLSDSTFGADLQLVMLREARFSPYLFAGIGSMNLNSSNMSTDRSSMRNAGAGFRARIFGDSRAALRGEYRFRDYHAYGTDLDDNLISLGIQIPFGEARPTFVDSDGDGVADGMDRCPNTPAGRTVDANGCETDSDGDGVSDGDDRCPNTPAGTPVSASGCPIDSDGDGVSDHIDECPNTVAGAVVDSRGCELDDDEDGVVNRLDKCPNTESGVQVDVAGCEIREEIRLPGVNFESNSDLLVRGTDSVLNDAAATLEKNPEITVEVAGHTDSDGAAEYNESLSARRAATVRDYLIGRGVSADRLTVRGYGESQPIADNSTADGKATNRRVVLRITAR